MDNMSNEIAVTAKFTYRERTLLNTILTREIDRIYKKLDDPENGYSCEAERKYAQGKASEYERIYIKVND